MMKRAPRIMLASLFIVSFFAQAKVTELTATVDKNPALVSESVVLEIVANDNVEQGSLDMSPLMKDFVVGRTSVSRQTQMVNFDTSHTTRWQTILIPRNPGNYRIPAFELEGVRSNPINLHVLPESQATQRQNQDIFISTEIDTKQLYLQQQATYTVKLHIAKDLQRGSLTEPTLAQANIQQIGKDKEYSQLVNGKRYRIIERNFAIQPQKSGTFVIEGPVFQGEVVTRNRGSSLFNMFNETKPISALSPKLTIEVLPIPGSYTGHWLPSEHVTLTEEWQPEQQEYILGEPITRTVTLTAMGVSEEQLPKISADYPNQVKVYPDKSDTATVQRDNHLIAQRVDSFAIVPSKLGKITLPAVEVPWFNSKTQQQEFARLPQRQIIVLADPEQQPVPVNNPADVDFIATATPETQVVTQLVDNPFWKIATAIFFSLWLLTLVSWFIHVRRIKAQPASRSVATTDQPGNNESQLWKQLQQAIKQQDASQVSGLLLPWLNSFHQQGWRNIEQAAKDLDAQKLRLAVAELQQSIYAKTATTWSPSQLKQALDEVRKKPNSRQKRTELRALYPD